MALSSITLSSFRCFNSLKIDLSPRANFFYGKNGSGKTSILEAIYLVCSGRSFKSSNIESAVMLDKESFHLKAYDNETGFIIEAYKERSKSIQLKLNNKKITISEAAKTFPATIIDNKTFSFTEAAPAFRRKILDRAVFLSDESYSANWFAYFRALKQRNKLLKDLDSEISSLRELAKSGQLELELVFYEINNIDDRSFKYDALDLSIEVMVADSTIHPNEVKLIEEIIEELGLNQSTAKKYIRNQILKMDKPPKDIDIEGLLKINPSISNKDSQKLIRREFDKWNSASTSTQTSKQRKHAQVMIDIISKVRERYV